MRRAGRAALAALVALGTAACVSGQSQLPRPTPPDESAGQYEQSLQGALDRRDYAQLASLMQGATTPHQRREALQWARRQSDAGASLVVPTLYSAALWRIGNSLDAGPTELGYRDIATRFLLYSLTVTTVDGLRCKDAEAAKRMTATLEQEDAAILDHAAERPAYARGQLLNAALELEGRTFPRRADDPYLCGAAGFEPSETWQAKTGEARAEVRTRLGKLLDERASKAGRS